jgi:DNA ligase-associated metallophosphoesterase
VKLSTYRLAVSAPPVVPNSDTIDVAGISLVADCAGVLFWPAEGLLAVADLHLEKGSSFAARGLLLPPYDTATTLGRLGLLIASYSPRVVVALGDSFHDREGPLRISPRDRTALKAQQRGRDWIWIAGNHDPDPADGIGGTFTTTFSLGPLTFRHDPAARYRTAWTSEAGASDRTAPQSAPSRTSVSSDGEITGHLHPSARVSQRGRSITRRCFATNGQRLVMPAFGAYTGGLNIRDAVFRNVFGSLDFTVHILGDRRLYALAAARCLAD